MSESAAEEHVEDVPISQKRLMDSPLVAWIGLFKKHSSHRASGPPQTADDTTPSVSYRDLYHGAFLKDVMCHVHTKSLDDRIITRGAKLDECMERLQNWTSLMKTIKSFYRDELSQVVTMKLPEIIRIAKDPEDEASYEDIRTTLLLLLGCAIQCERKEFFIQQIIQELSEEQQHAIKDSITELKERTVEFTNEITENMDNVFSLETPLDSLGITGKALYYHLNRVLDERDMYIEEAAQATVDYEICYHQLEEWKARSLAQPTSPEKHHIGVELAEYKAKARRLRLELEEKADVTADMRTELEEYKVNITKLREENKTLTVDARSARAYRDELDIVREKAMKVDKQEKIIQGYKDQMHERDFYKSRFDELTEENKSLIELRVMLEDQLATSELRNNTVIELENELMSKRKELEELTASHEKEQDYIREMQEYVHKLECDKNSTLNESANLEEELAGLKGLARSNLSQSLHDQLNSTSNTEILKLELEIKRLNKVISDLKEQALVENNAHIMELETENKRLAAKVEKLQATNTKAGQDSMELEQERLQTSRHRDELQKALETVKENSDRQVKELEQENEHLTETIVSLRKRNEQSMDNRIKDVEKENKRMAEVVQERNQKLSKVEYELKNMLRDYTQLQSQSEEQTERCERENTELHKELQTLRLTVEKYEQVEQDLSDKELEITKLHKQIANLKAKLTNVDAVNQENITLTVDVQRLQKSLAASKEAVTRVADLEHDVEERDKEVTHLQRTIAVLEAEKSRLHDLEVKLYTTESENQKLTKHLELNAKKLEAKLEEFSEAQTDNKKLEETIQKLRLDNRKLERLGEENRSLEDANHALTQERDSKEKEIKKLRQSIELKETTIDEYSMKLENVERETKQLKRSSEKLRVASTRVKENEKENSDLISQAKIDKKTISTLREELVQEKIRVQQLTNELEQFRSELHKIGLDKDKLQANASIADEERLKVLQNMMEDAHKRSLEIKDEKIKVLEEHLEDSKNLCATLNRQLETMQKDYQLYLERRREEQNAPSTTINVHPSPGKPSQSISQLVIKKTPQGHMVQSEQFVSVQTQLIATQKRNGTLLSENAGLKSNMEYMSERMKKLEEQLASKKDQTDSVTNEKNSLQAHYAQLQVENTTLSSQANSLHKQNTGLQSQLAKLQATFDEIAISHQELNETYESLVTDHEQLQILNEQLSSEYEALISEHGLLKSQHKSLRDEVHELERNKQTLCKEKAAIEEMRQSMQKERLSRQFDDSYSEQYRRVNEDNQIIQQQTEKLRGEYRDLLSEYKVVKTDYNSLKLKHTELKGDMADCRDQLNKSDVHNAKLANKCESLEHQNCKLEEENRQLIHQLQNLLQQNQELLGQTLESSEHFREEEDKYRDQLSHLRRTKEKLEEKIMDQYRTSSRSKKKSGIGANLIKKAQGFIARESDEDPSSPRHASYLRQSDGKLKPDVSRSQLDLTSNISNGVPSAEDNKSLGDVSIGSRGSRESRSSSGQTMDQEGITITKSNKAHRDNKVKLRRNRMKAQSIENMFDAVSHEGNATSRSQPGDRSSHYDRSPSSVQSRFDGDRSFNSTFSHKLATDHRKIAVSTTALNMPVSVNTLREISMTIPVDQLANQRKGARSSDNLLEGGNSTPNDSRLRTDPHRGDMRRGYSDEVPTKDVGLRTETVKSSSVGGMFYTPPSLTRDTVRAVPRLSIDESESDELFDSVQSNQSQTNRYLDRMMRDSSSSQVSSPKPDLVMGTEASPRAIVYNDRSPQSNGPPAAMRTPPKYGDMRHSKSQPVSMYASLDSRLNTTPSASRETSTPRYHNNRGIPTQSVRPLKPTNQSNFSSNNRPSDLSASTSNLHRPNRDKDMMPPGSQRAREENPTWFEYGCV